MSLSLKRFLAAGSSITLTGLVALGCSGPPPYSAYPSEIPLGEYHDQAPAASVSGSSTANALDPNPVPQHPFLTANGRNGTHADAYSSGTYKTAGPLGINPIVDSAIPTDYWRNQQLLALAGECLTQTFSSDGKLLYSLCADVNVFKLIAMDITDNFRRVAVLDMPARANKFESLADQAQDSSGGVYFHVMDDGAGDQILTTNGKEQIQIITAPSSSGGSFNIAETYNVKPFLKIPSDNDVNASKITDVMIDWNDNNLIWFISKDGYVGIVDRSDSSVKTIQLEHTPGGGSTVEEEIQNSIAIDANGLYVVSNYAMYRLKVGIDGDNPVIDWRANNYDRGGNTSGTFSAGSGTTPTAFGPDYIAITDFADPIKVVVYSRATGAEVCSEPVFNAGSSSTENSLIGYYDSTTSIGSIIVENNHGYELPIDPDDVVPVSVPTPGVARVDISAGGNCSEPWTRNDVTSPSLILKLSTDSGLIYTYTTKYNDYNNSGTFTMNEIAWYLTGLNFQTGATEFETLISTGKEWNNHYAALSIGPDGKAYIGTLRGIISVEDGNP